MRLKHVACISTLFYGARARAHTERHDMRPRELAFSGSDKESNWQGTGPPKVEEVEEERALHILLCS